MTWDRERAPAEHWRRRMRRAEAAYRHCRARVMPAARDAGDRAPRPDRRAREQRVRARHVSGGRRGRRSRRLARGVRHQRVRHHDAHAGNRAAHEAAEARRDRDDQHAGDAQAICRGIGLRCIEGRARGCGKISGARARRARDPCEQHPHGVDVGRADPDVFPAGGSRIRDDGGGDHRADRVEHRAREAAHRRRLRARRCSVRRITRTR